MVSNITIGTELKENVSCGIILNNLEQFSLTTLSENEGNYARNKLEKENDCTVFSYPKLFFFGKISTDKKAYQQKEEARKAGAKFFEVLKAEKIKTAQIFNFTEPGLTLPFLEGILLASYSFSKYKKEKDDFDLSELFVFGHSVSEQEIEEFKNEIQAVFHARDLVNEPLSYLTATKFAQKIEKLGKNAGFEVEVFNKKKIESLKMGGLLAVNKGSIDPPTFSILEWKPKDAKNKKPIVLVGKGVVFDTGGLSLKPTAKSMDYMKCDMAGAAVVVATIFAVAKNKLPVHVIGLVPATDNRPDGNAYVPGDVVTMFDGTTVEIKNTDAEGRLLLADALSYAKKYQPELVIDIATLTGAAEIVAGNQAIVAMGNSEKNVGKLKTSGFETYERLIEVPLWEEYAKPLKSSIADLNNLGSREAQSTTAGKFLEHFTNYNWIHLDAAGVSFSFEKEAYIPIGGSGIGTRLFYNFLKKFN